MRGQHRGSTGAPPHGERGGRRSKRREPTEAPIGWRRTKAAQRGPSRPAALGGPAGDPLPYRTEVKAPMQATPVGVEARSTGRTDATDLGFWEPKEQGGRKGKLHGRSNGVNHGRIRRRGVSTGGCGGQSRSAGGGATRRRRRNARKGRPSWRERGRIWRREAEMFS